MIRVTKNIFYIAVCLLFSVPEIAFMQTINKEIDQVPRDRLVTDDELLDLIDKATKDLITVNGKNSIENLADYFKSRKSPNYFFNSQNVISQLDVYLNAYPEEKTRINEKVEEDQAAYGTNIDWLLPSVDLHNRSLTPNSIRHIARFPNAYEYSLSSLSNDDSKTMNLFLNQLKDFINDYEKGEVESDENDVFERFYAGHRTRNILFAHNLLLANNNYDFQDQIYMMKVFLLHGAKLIDVCKDFHWGNHQLHGLAGLYEMATMYPEFPVMNLWKKLALNTIMEHIEKEILDDGFQFERASHYFKLDIMNYFRIYKISSINNTKLPELFNERFNKMFDAIVNLSLPNKKLPVLQDAQGKYDEQNGKLENNDAAELSDPKESMYMTIGSILFNNPVYKYFSDEILPAELYWFFSDLDRKEYSNLKIDKPLIGSVGLEKSNYYVMRTGWEEDSYYLLIDGGLAKYKPDHTHGGILGIFASVNGENVLPTYRVRYSEPTYRYLKNSKIKNVALADGLLQGRKWKSNNARTGFGHWEELPKPTVHDWIAGENYDYFSGSHNSFTNNGIEYNRSIIFFKPNFWLVIDDFNSTSLHSYQQLWQGDFDILESCNGIVKSNNLNKFYIIQSDFTDMEIESYSKFGYNSYKFEKEGQSNYSFYTALIPSSTKLNDEPTVREYERDDYKQIVVENGAIKSSYYLNKGKIIKLDEIESDAKFICANYENDVLQSYLVYNGSYCSLEGTEVKLDNKSTFEVTFNSNNELVYKILK